MVKVANDPVLAEGDLPAPNQPPAPELPEVSGISLRLIAGLAATAHGLVHADPPRLDVTVDGTTPLRSALRDARAGSRLSHRLGAARAPAPPRRLDVTVDATPPLRSALRAGGAGSRLSHRLVLADATALAEHADAADPLADVVATLGRAGAAGLVVSGLSGEALATLVV